MKIEQIFLDVDGVLADWVGGVCDLFDVDQKALEKNWGKKWDIVDALSISHNDMWTEIDNAGADFWSGLNPYPWAMDLYGLCCRVAPTTILTAPSAHPSAIAGKAKWLNDHLGQDGRSFRNFLIGPHKEACSHPGALLIDDNELNCTRFLARRGGALLFPRPWNSARGRSVNDFIKGFEHAYLKNI